MAHGAQESDIPGLTVVAHIYDSLGVNAVSPIHSLWTIAWHHAAHHYHRRRRTDRPEAERIFLNFPVV
jgi:hypothetical protein